MEEVNTGCNTLAILSVNNTVFYFALTNWVLKRSQFFVSIAMINNCFLQGTCNYATESADILAALECH